MSIQNSGRSAKSLSGNGVDLPHMQSSLSPQGYGLYNSVGGAGDAPFIPEDSTSIASGLSPLKKQTISYNDYLISHPQHDSSNISAALQDSSWNGKGNENLTASRNIIDAKALEKSQQQQRQHYSGNNSFTGNRAAATTMENLKAGSTDFGNRDRQKDRLIDSLSNSDMITCLPGFKKGPTFHKTNRICSSGLSDKVTHFPMQQRRNQIGNIQSSGPLPTVRGPIVPSSASVQQTPGSLSPALNYQKSIDGAVIPIGEINGPSSSAANGNSSVFRNSVTTAIGGNRRTPPASPITRATAAIGRAQSEISKINTFMENEADRRKPPGAWKNMGTPFFSEPLTKSAQRQQKAQYRIDLERQIQASRLRKAEEERKERDSNDHPLGPEYAHPALTYYNPPQKIFSFADHGKTPSATTTVGALTKLMKEKYSLDIPGSGNTIGAYTSGYPLETGVGGSTTALGRIAPLQQTKKEAALKNLMKSRMHPGAPGNRGDQNHGNSSRLLPMNQLQTGGTSPHNNNEMVMAMQPGNGARLPQQQQWQQTQQFSNQAEQAFVGEHANRPPQQQTQHQQHHPAYNPQHQHQDHQQQYAYSPPRPYGMNAAAAAWPMPMYAGYPQYYAAYGQPMYSSANHGPANVQQQQQLQAQQQLGYQHLSPPALPAPPPPASTKASPPSLRSILHDRHVDEDSGGDAEDDLDIDFEILKEKAYKTQKIWQTSDELPDPGLRTAVYKAELRKQIDEDRKRKAERVAREKEEDERIERKIREFHEEERRRMKVQQQTRVELEGYHRHKIEKQRKKSDAFTVTRHPERWGKEARPRSRSSLLAEKLASFGPDAGDFEDPADDPYGCYYRRHSPDENAECYECSEKEFDAPLEPKRGKSRPTRQTSPPVPVVQKKLIENFLLEDCKESKSPRRQISSLGQDFLFQLKSKLKSERDLVERRLQEKLESTHKNMNLLKYTMNN